MRVWLDDVRPEPPGWLWVKTAKAAIELLRTGNVTEISLDHDLELDHYKGLKTTGTGMDVLNAIAGLDPLPVIHIHTRNPRAYVAMLNRREEIRRG